MFNALGDSNTVGVGATQSKFSWVGRFTPTNNAVSGSQAAEVSNRAITITSTLDSIFTLMVGTNDVRNYKSDVIKQQYYKKFLRSAVAWLLYPNKVIARNMTATGSWTNTQANNIGMVSTQQGATLTTQVAGNKIYVGYIIQNATSATSLANIYIDNILVGQISCDGQTPSINTVNGLTYATACNIYQVQDGNHEVKIEVASNGKNLYVDYVTGNNQNTSKVVLGNIPKYSKAGYTFHGVTESMIIEYNNIIEDLAYEFGINIADNFNTVTQSDLSDYVHLNNNGHLIVHNNFKDLI